MEYDRKIFSKARMVTRFLGYEDDQSFIPYNDGEINMMTNPYEGNDRTSKTAISEAAVDGFVARVIMDQTAGLAEGKKDYEHSSLFDGAPIPEKYKYRSAEYPEFLHLTGTAPPKRNHNKPKSRSGSRRSKEREDTAKYNRDAPPGSEISMCDGVPMITLPLPLLKQYMLSEVEARVRGIHNYYETRHDAVNKDRMRILGQMIELKELQKELVAQTNAAMKELERYKANCDAINHKVEAAKEAKRRRRKIKKQRNTDIPMRSQSETSPARDHAEADDTKNASDDEIIVENNDNDNNGGET